MRGEGNPGGWIRPGLSTWVPFPHIAACAAMFAGDDRGGVMAAIGSEIERLIQLLAKLPGLGPRSARRAALALLKKRDTLLEPLAEAMTDAAAAIKPCEICGNLDTKSPCAI